MLIRNCSCCPPPPEPPEGECYCPDPCMFTITVVEPIQYGPQPTVPCAAEESVLGTTSPSTIGSECVDLVNERLDPDYVDTTPSEFSFTGCRIDTYQTGYAPFAIIGAHVAATTHLSRERAFSGEPVPIVVTEAWGGAYLRCLSSDPRTNEPLDGPRLFMLVYFHIDSRYFRVGANPSGADIPVISQKLTQLGGYYDIEAECDDKPNSTCEELGRFETNALRPASPIEFTVSIDDSGLGAWPAPNTLTNGSDIAWGCHDAMAAGFTPTFRISQRQSCTAVDCDCNADVCGLVADVRAYPGGPLIEWILCKPEEEQSRDREFSCTIEGVSYTCLYKYREVTETRNGFAVDIHRFIYERFANPPDVSGFPRERKVADLWCDGDGWMMDFQTVCIRLDLDTGFGGGYEEDRAVGEIVCGPACGNDGSSRDPGDRIPLGSAFNVIGVPGFPYSEGELSCDIGLGERMSVEIRQTLTC